MSESVNLDRYQSRNAVLARLNEIGLPATMAEVSQLTSLRDRAQVVRALDAAPTNAPAKTFLQKALQEARTKSATPSQVPVPADALPPPDSATPDPTPVPASAPTRVPQRAPGVSSTPSVVGNHRYASGQPMARLAPPDEAHPLGPAPSGEPAPGAAVAGGESRKYDQHVVYGKETAVQFERSPNKEKTTTTVNLSMAKAKGATCKEGIAWEDAIRVMLEPHEVQLLIAAMLGHLPTARFAGHGPKNDKWFEVSENCGDYAGSVRVTLAQGNDKRRVNVSALDIAPVVGVLMRAAKDQLKLQNQELLTAIRRTADLHAKGIAARDSRSSSGAGQQQQRRAG